MITSPKIHTDLLWDLSFLFISLGIIYFIAIFFYRNKRSSLSKKVTQRKRELSPMISEFIFIEDNASKEEQSNYIRLKIEIRQLIKDDFNRKILAEVLLDLQKDVSGDAQKRLFKLYQDLNLHTDAFERLKSWRWEVVSKAIADLTQMQVSEAYSFITKFINDKRATIRKQAEIAIVTLQQEGIHYFLDTTKHKISEWQQLKLLDVIRNQKDYEPPRFKVWLTSTNSYVVLFALRLIKFYNQNDANNSLIELVKHKNNQIKQEAIGCIKEFQVVEALETLKVIFWKSTTNVKISILDTIANLGTEDEIEFLKSIENKVSDFYVKSKAISSINFISSESILPTEGILDTSDYQIPDDITVALNANKSLDYEELMPLVSKAKSKEKQFTSKKLSKAKQEQQNQTIIETPVESINLDFLPLVVTEPSDKQIEQSTFHNLNCEAINNLQVRFTDISVSHKQTIDEHNPILNDSFVSMEHDAREDLKNQDLAFLPIVVTNVNEKPFKYIKVQETEETFSVNDLEVEFERVDGLSSEEVLEENFRSTQISFDHYSTEQILNTNVNFEEIIFERTEKEILNEINVIDPYFLTHFTTEMKENKMDDTSNESPENSITKEAMNRQDEEKFKKIINDLIVFENKEQMDEIIEEFQNSSFHEFQDEPIDIDFIPLIEESSDNSLEPKNLELKDTSRTFEKKEIKNNIPSSILSDELFETPVLIALNEREKTMQLLNDISELGDHRELVLLKEMLANQKYVEIKKQVEQLILRFSTAPIEKEESNQIKLEELKAFNVFEDLFRVCDTEAKLILLDEVLAIGDKGEIEFLEDLVLDSELKISTRAKQVLKQLQSRLSEKNETKIDASIENTSQNSNQVESTFSWSEKVKKTDHVSKDYTPILDELEINSSPTTESIFDLTFEITPEDRGDTNASKPEQISEKSLINQFYHFSNKIIEKING